MSSNLASESEKVMLSVKEFNGYWQKIIWNLNCIDTELIFLKHCSLCVNSVFKILQWLTFAISVLHNVFPITASTENFTKHRDKLTSILAAERGWFRGLLCVKLYLAAPGEKGSTHWKSLASWTKWKLLLWVSSYSTIWLPNWLSIFYFYYFPIWRFFCFSYLFILCKIGLCNLCFCLLMYMEKPSHSLYSSKPWPSFRRSTHSSPPF